MSFAEQTTLKIRKAEAMFSKLLMRYKLGTTSQALDWSCMTAHPLAHGA